MSSQMAFFTEVDQEKKKLCPGCDEEKPLSYFYRRARNPDGYGHRCANCENPKRKTYGPVIRAKENRVLSIQAERKQKYKSCMSRQDKKTDVVKRDLFCRVCGSSKKLEVHHISFARKKELDKLDYLTCLCATCHKLIHQITTQ